MSFRLNSIASFRESKPSLHLDLDSLLLKENKLKLFSGVPWVGLKCFMSSFLMIYYAKRFLLTRIKMLETFSLHP